MNLKGTHILFLLAIIVPYSLHASKLISVANGNWNSSSTWSPSRTPGNNDTITVTTGNTVTVNLNSPTYSNVVLNVNGTLFFNNGQKLNFDCNSIVSVSNTGKLDGGNPGSKIDMCGSTVWRGPGPDQGPFVYGFNPLPINLLSFSANNCADKVCISWTTLTETNNDYFTVEKTKDDVNYELVENLKGAGNSTSVKHYSITDNNPYNGVSYYRLKQTDFNGDFAYYSLREVDRSVNTDFTLNLFPNPGERGDVNMSIHADSGEEVLVVVFDAFGREAFSKIVVTEKRGENVFALDPNGVLSKGVYFVESTSDRKVESKKLIIR